ncbi:MAG: hypothetical protein ACRD52_11025 [Candidatus Acidiferrales bacterium]
MREIKVPGQIYEDDGRHLEKLKELWSKFTRETFLAIAEQEKQLQDEKRPKRAAGGGDT